MSSPAYSIVYSAVLAANVSAGFAGDVLIPDATSGLYVLATTAARGTRRSTGVALAAYAASSAVQIQQFGQLSAALSGLGTGTASYVRVSALGRLERCTPSGTDDVVGWCETDGVCHLTFGQPPGGFITGTATADGKTVVAMADASQALTDAEGRAGLVQTTGALTADRTLTFAAPAAAANSYLAPLLNSCTGANLLVSVGTGQILVVGPGAKALLQITASGVTCIADLPYDPRDFGAACDGLTDDLSSWQAMLDAMPAEGGYVHVPIGSTAIANITSGMPWLSEPLRISKPIKMRGGGGMGYRHFGFEHAPGRTALILDSALVSIDGNSATGFDLGNIDLKSQLLIHPSFTGVDSGHGLKAYAVDWGTTIRVGDLFVEAAAANPTRCYRVTSMTTNGGRGPGAFSGVPAWSTTIGATVVSNGITWTTEAVPSVRADSTAYVLGERVTTLSDNRGVFTCTQAGTTASSPPAGLAGDTAAVGLQVGGTYTDGTVEWRFDAIAGIYVRAGLGTVSRIHGYDIYGSVVLLQGGVGQDADGTTNADSVELDDIRGEHVGLVCHVAGDDSNGYRIRRLWGLNVGSLIPNPDAVTAGNWLVAGGGGGHLLHDHSLASGSCADGYVQLSTGRPILKTGLGRLKIDSVFQEIPGLSYVSSVGYALCMGGSLSFTTDSSVMNLDMTGGAGTGITERSISGGTTVSAGMTVKGAKSVFPFTVVDGLPDNWAWRYAYGVPAGFWELSHGLQAYNQAFWLGGAQAGVDPGPGHLGFPLGHFVGVAGSSPLYRGTIAAWTDLTIRGGSRLAGDTYRDATTEITVTSGGFKASAWVANTAVRETTATWGIAATVVEPTATGASLQAGQQVWRCTTAGTTHATTEPTWPGSPTVDVTTQADGSAVWTFIGSTPEVVVKKTGRQATSDATPVYVTLATLGVGEVREFDATCKVTSADGTTRQVFKLAAVYYGAAGPTATIDGTISSTATGTGSASVTFSPTGATVRLSITGIAGALATTYEVDIL